MRLAIEFIGCCNLEGVHLRIKRHGLSLICACGSVSLVCKPPWFSLTTYVLVWSLCIHTSFFTPAVCGNPVTFDTGLQGYTNVQGDDFDWTRQSGSTGSFNTGPTRDHTFGNAKGKNWEHSSSSLGLSNLEFCASFFWNRLGTVLLLELVCRWNYKLPPNIKWLPAL